MPMTPLPTLDRTSATFREDVDTFFGSQLPAFAAEANALQVDVTAKQSTASGAASAATTKAGEALASANSAATAKDTSVAAKDASVAAKVLAEAAAASITAQVAVATHAASAKTTPVDADEIPLADSASSFSLKRLTWASMKSEIGAYTKTNILGTVSRSAGVPTGAVIERGSNANGEYVRFADGTQICTGISPSLTANGSFGAVFGSGSATATYAASFAAVPKVCASCDSVSGWVISLANTNTSVDFYGVSPVSGTTLTPRYIAVGRWF